MCRVWCLLLALCTVQVHATKAKNKTVQDVLAHYAPIVNGLHQQVMQLSQYYHNETDSFKMSLQQYPEDLQQKSTERGNRLQVELRLLKSEAKAAPNYSAIYQKCRPQINTELDALQHQNEAQRNECMKHLENIQIFLNNTNLPRELHNLTAETANTTLHCKQFNRIGLVRKCFSNKINGTIKPHLRKLEKEVDTRLMAVKRQLPALQRPYMACSYGLNDNIVHGVREITVGNLRKCIRNSTD